MSKVALLTGAGGFLGSHCLRHLLVNTDWRIVCPITFAHKGTPERIITAVDTEAWWPRIQIVKCDLSARITDVTAARFASFGQQPSVIINYASESHVDRSITDPTSFVRNNVDIVLNLLDYARTLSLDAFVQISTDEVYGPAPRGADHREWDPIVPSNPYSASKAAQEAVAIAYWRTYAIPLIMINCMNLIGETQDPEKFVPMVIGRVLRGETVPIHASAAGEIGSRYYLHARNLADAVLFLLRRGQLASYAGGANRPDRWHVVGEREITNLEMAQMVAETLGAPLRYELVDFHTSRPGHDLRYALDGGKLAAAGWVPPVSFELSLKTLVSWTLRNPLWSERTVHP